MYSEKIIDSLTGEETIRPYTADEVAEVNAAIKQTQLEAEQTKKAAAAKAVLLERLGITEEEAKLLLG